MCTDNSLIEAQNNDTQDFLNKRLLGLQLGRDAPVAAVQLSARSAQAMRKKLQPAILLPILDHGSRNAARLELLNELEHDDKHEHRHHAEHERGEKQEKSHTHEEGDGMDALTLVSLCRSDAGDQDFLDLCATGNLEKVNALLMQGVSVDGCDVRSRTPLHNAAANGHGRVVKRLLSAGADVHAVDIQEKTPMHHATSRGFLQIARHLIEAGADVNACDRVGKTALHYAAEQCGADGPATHVYAAMTELLVRYGADTNVQDTRGRTALMLAVEKLNFEIARTLLRTCPDLSLKDDKGQTALHVASANKCTTGLISILVEAGAEVDERDFMGKTPLHLASRSTALALVAQGASTEVRDLKGKTALHCACERMAMDVVGALLESKAEVNARDKSNRTPLDLVNSIADVQLKGARKALKVLLKHQGAKKGGASFLACLLPSC